MKIYGICTLQLGILASLGKSLLLPAVTTAPDPILEVHKRGEMSFKIGPEIRRGHKKAVGTYSIPVMSVLSDAPDHVPSSVDLFNSIASSALVFGGNLQEYANMYNIIASSFNLHYAQSV